MAEVLSQNEIDTLLAALSSGSVDVNGIKEEEEQRRIRIYDFRRPNRFSKEQIRTLYMPVSYTHLDVYKRQRPSTAWNCAGAFRWPENFLGCAFADDHVGRHYCRNFY